MSYLFLALNINKDKELRLDLQEAVLSLENDLQLPNI
jgi:hypothetical protein